MPAITESPLLVSTAVGNIEVKRKGDNVEMKVTSFFEDRYAGLSYSPDSILHNGTTYQLYYPIRCKLSKEEDYYLIESEQLDIVATGRTIAEAERNFAEEFDYIFKRYNELPDMNLSDKIKRVKKVLEAMIQKVIA